jgi:transcriptional regulator GlxA family with amidase domain
VRIVFLLYPGVTALDVIGPYEVFNSLREFDIRFAWKKAGPVVTDNRRLVLGASHALGDIERCDVLVVPGSSSDTLTMMTDQTVLDWIRGIHPSTRYTASVCSGALILGAAGLLEGLSATTHWAAMPGLKQFGATPAPDERIVEEGRIITAAGVSAGIDLGLYLVGQLVGEDKAEIAQLFIEYDPQPPFDSGHMSKASDMVAIRARALMARQAVSNPKNLFSLPKYALGLWRRALRKAGE